MEHEVGGRRWIAYLVVAVACVLPIRLLAQAQVAPQHKDVVYATVDGKKLGLDIYMPAGVQPPPLLVWVHGGAWRSRTKERVTMVFVEQGIATASLDFRLSIEARFPAAVHDIKAAIRFLRANASEYGYRTDRIAISGSSSGGTWRRWSVLPTGIRRWKVRSATIRISHPTCRPSCPTSAPRT